MVSSPPFIGLLLLICMLKAGETLLAHSWSLASCLLVCSYAVLRLQSKQKRWIVRVMGPDAEDLRAFVGLFLLLPIYVRLGLEPSLSNLDILILAELYLLPWSCINFCPGCELNQITGGLQGWHGCMGCVGQLGGCRAASLLVRHELFTWFRHLWLDSWPNWQGCWLYSCENFLCFL